MEFWNVVFSFFIWVVLKLVFVIGGLEVVLVVVLGDLVNDVFLKW